MTDSPTPAVADRAGDVQRRIRTFVTDVVTATIGRGVRLDHWVSRAIFEKLYLDIASYVPKFGKVGAEAVQKIAEDHADLHDGVLYLHKQKTVLVLRVVEKTLIQVVRASDDVRPDAETARKIAAEISSQGFECTTAAVIYIPFDSNNDYDIHVEAYHPDPDEESRATQFCKALVLATITQNSTRDLQRMPGPSDLANPCDMCVARRISASGGFSMQQAPQHFSLKAWVGTGIHEKLERDLPGVYPHAQQEITVPITAFQGFGAVKGHTDIFFPRKRAMGDWKSTDMKKLERIRIHGVSPAHFGQTMLYMYGLKKKGMEVDYATLIYIPRDSKNTSDIYVVSCAYREDVALGLLNRTQSLLDRLRSGDVGSIVSDPECFVCTVQPKLRR